MTSKKTTIRILLLLLIAILAACDQDGKNTAQAGSQTPPAAAPANQELPNLSLPSDTGATPTFDSARAMQYVKEMVAYGPRPLGSANHRKVEDFIVSNLKGDAIDDDVFTADTPEGKFPVRNIVAKFPGTRDGVIVIASHYDTNYPLRQTTYIGANDGASSSALLLEFANQLRGKKRDGYSIWLVWDDAEEAVKSWSDTDSLYGIRHLAEKWEGDGTLKK